MIVWTRYAYSVFPYIKPKLAPDPAQRERTNLIFDLKDDRRIQGLTAADYFAAIVAQHKCPALGSDVTLVPIPTSKQGPPAATSAPRRLAESLVRAGLGGDVVLALERTETIPSSSRSPAAERVTVKRHHETIEMVRPVPSGRVVLVDDVLTRGSTSIASIIEIEGGGCQPTIFTAGFTVFPESDRSDWQIRRISWTEGSEQALNDPHGHW
jgi:hypothetical protein